MKINDPKMVIAQTLQTTVTFKESQIMLRETNDLFKDEHSSRLAISGDVKRRQFFLQVTKNLFIQR